MLFNELFQYFKAPNTSVSGYQKLTVRIVRLGWPWHKTTALEVKRVHSKGKAWSQVSHLLSLHCGRALTTVKGSRAWTRLGNSNPKLSWSWWDWAKAAPCRSVPAPRSPVLLAQVIPHGWAQAASIGQRAGTDPGPYAAFNALPCHLRSSDVQLWLLGF